MATGRQGQKYHIEGGGLRVTWDEKRFTWAAQRGKRRWESAEPEPDALKVRAPKSMAVAMRFARRVKTTPFENGALVGVACEAADLPGLPRASRLSLSMVLAIEKATGEFVVQIDGEAEGLFFEHPAGGPTRVGPWWPGSLGRIAYPRRIRYSFFDRCDYVSLCKHYRRYVMRTGKFVSLREKIAATPKVGRLIGSPVIHTCVAHTVHPQSPFWHKEQLQKRFRRPFRDVAQDLRNLHARGVSRAYLHLDGWGVNGYDSHHPDYLPPCREAGGWAGLRRLADTCAELGILFALHDQYRDYYHNAETFDPAYAIHDAHGKVPDYSWWLGGPQSVLCARFAPAYVLRNHEALRARGIRVDGTYLDVFAIVPAEECFHPAHRMNRRECLELRAECFHIIRDLEGIASSEEPVDYALPHLHLVHHGPYPEGGVLTELTGSKENTPLPTVPLWCLVYHDALLLPWSAPTQAALHGGMPYLGLRASDAEIAAARRIGRLHAKVALEEMVDHEFLSEDRTKQRTTFADGTMVTADIGARRWRAPKGPQAGKTKRVDRGTRSERKGV